MTTILTVGDSDGERRCDARCYSAKGPDCECCCGGRNHSIGLQAALEGNQEFVAELAGVGLKVVAGNVQLVLELPGVEP